MSSYTPGPWEWNRHNGNLVSAAKLPGMPDHAIVIGPKGYVQMDGDRNLIAASPELLEVLERIVFDYSKYNDPEEFAKHAYWLAYRVIDKAHLWKNRK